MTEELLPYLFNSSSRRKKDMNSLFPHLSNQIYRCREFPHGIYINEYGELCPQDQRTGIFKAVLSPIRKRKHIEDNKTQGDLDKTQGDLDKTQSDLDPEDLDNDEARDSDDEYWSKEEERSRKRQKGQKVKEDNDDDDDYEDDHEQTSEEEEDDDEEEEEDKFQSSKLVERPTLLSVKRDQRAKESVYEEEEEEQKEAIRQLDHTIELERRNRKERIKRQKVLNFLENFVEEWTTESRRLKKIGQKVIKIETNPKLYQSAPQCDLQFISRGYPPLKARLNMENEDQLVVLCDCGKLFSTVRSLYQHLVLHQ